MHDHLPADVQLVLLEYAVNTDRKPASFERLLRKLLLHPRRPAIIVVNAHRWRAIRPHDGRTDKCWHRSWPVDMARNRTQWLAQSAGRRSDARDFLAADEDDIAALCRHYNVPLVSMRAALVDAVRGGEVALPSFMNDCKHPSGVGHTFLAQLILQRLLHAPPGADDHATATASSSAAAAAAAAPRCASVPPPRDPSELRAPLYGEEGREMASSVCARGEQLRRYVEPAWTDGFNLTDEGRGKGKLGYLAHGVGKSIGFCLPWPRADASTRPVLWIGFLRSYEHMGRARVTCSGACGCGNGEVIDGHDIKDGVSVTDVRKVALRPSRRGPGGMSFGGGRRGRGLAEAALPPAAAGGDVACCHVQLTIAPGTSSGEHKFKVMSLLLGGADAHHLQVFSLRVAASASEVDTDGGAAAATGKGRRGGGGGRRGGGGGGRRARRQALASSSA